jgi:hypothetical protein
LLQSGDSPSSLQRPSNRARLPQRQASAGRWSYFNYRVLPASSRIGRRGNLLPFPRTRRFQGTGSRLLRRSQLVDCSAEGQTRFGWLLWETGPSVQSKRLRSGRLRRAASRDLLAVTVPNESFVSVACLRLQKSSPISLRTLNPACDTNRLWRASASRLLAGRLVRSRVTRSRYDLVNDPSMDVRQPKITAGVPIR